MPLDPTVRTILDQMASLGLPPIETQTAEEARRGLRALAGMTPGEAVARVEDRRVPGPAGAIPVRLYAPAGPAPLPLLVYFHGGGWVVGGLDSHDATCRALANRAGTLVLSVDYRLAPEHPFPAAVDDCWAATCWAAAHGATIGGDPTRLAVAGDSAGGNLAAVVAQLARDRGGVRLRHQVLVYPVTDTAMNTPSSHDNGDGYFLTRAAMAWFFGHYLPHLRDREHPRAAPLRARDFARLPPATVITAEFDPLRDEGEAYAARLREAGVPVTLARYDGMIHGFVSMASLLPQGAAALDRIAAALRDAFTA